MRILLRYKVTYLTLILLQKVYGEWHNEGSCNGIGDDNTCGKGKQVQIRPCMDGKVDKCKDEEKKRTISCKEAGTELADCSKF